MTTLTPQGCKPVVVADLMRDISDIGSRYAYTSPSEPEVVLEELAAALWIADCAELEGDGATGSAIRDAVNTAVRCVKWPRGFKPNARSAGTAPDP